MSAGDDGVVRREAVERLGDAMRRAMLAAIETETSAESLLEAARQLDEISTQLEQVKRGPGQMSSADDWGRGIRMYSPVSGRGNPQAFPLEFERDGTRATAFAAFDRRFEGPPGHVHGGHIALLLDEVLARPMLYGGAWGLTGKFDITFRRPVPLSVPCVLTADVANREGRKTTVRGGIYDANDPNVAFVESYAVFIEPRADREADHFSAIVDSQGRRTSHRLQLTEHDR